MKSQQPGTSRQRGHAPGKGENPAGAADFANRHLGAIKFAAVFMAVLIVILTAVIAATIISRLGRVVPGEETASIELPAGARLVSAAGDGGGLVLVVEYEGRREIWRIDENGERVQTIRVNDR